MDAEQAEAFFEHVKIMKTGDTILIIKTERGFKITSTDIAAGAITEHEGQSFAAAWFTESEGPDGAMGDY